MKATQGAGKALQVAVDPVGVHDRASLETAFATIRRQRIDALMTTADAVLLSYRTLIVEFADERGLIAMYGDRAYVRAGGLVFYGTSNTDMWRHAATHVDRIIKGAKPADLPVERNSRFHLVVNLKVARAIGVVVPDTLLRIADEVIE